MAKVHRPLLLLLAFIRRGHTKKVVQGLVLIQAKHRLPLCDLGARRHGRDGGAHVRARLRRRWGIRLDHLGRQRQLQDVELRLDLCQQMVATCSVQQPGFTAYVLPGSAEASAVWPSPLYS